MKETSRASTPGRNGSAAPRSRSKAVVPSADIDRAGQMNGSNPNDERVVRSESLLQGRSHISITHEGKTYQLRATRLGKLILTM
jgi:hemin uptake protein HemP